MKERDMEIKIKNSQDQVKSFEEKAKEQNMTLEMKNRNIVDQRTHLEDLNQKLNSHLKVENETQIQLNELIKNNSNFKQDIQLMKVNETILQRQINQSKEITDSLKKEVDQKQQ